MESDDFHAPPIFAPSLFWHSVIGFSSKATAVLSAGQRRVTA
jgi:hypothetical protein